MEHVLLVLYFSCCQLPDTINYSEMLKISTFSLLTLLLDNRGKMKNICKQFAGPYNSEKLQCPANRSVGASKKYK